MGILASWCNVRASIDTVLVQLPACWAPCSTVRQLAASILITEIAWRGGSGPPFPLYSPQGLSRAISNELDGSYCRGIKVWVSRAVFFRAGRAKAL